MLRMNSIAKRYGPTVALDGVDFSVEPGEVMALLGENGAGKSTLVKILAGLEVPDSGEIKIDGRSVHFHSPSQAHAAGIAYVAQELSIVDDLSVAENVFLGDAAAGLLRRPARLARMARPFLDQLGLGSIDPLARAGPLSVAERQLVEIARLLSRRARIAILDEPTAALSDAEIERVEAAVRTLSREGCAVIYVTHRLPEVFRLSQRVTILRNGRSFAGMATAELDVDTLIEHMLGRRLDQMFPDRRPSLPDREILAAEDCLAPGLNVPVTLAVRQGEILGLAGQVGSGANSFVRMLAGVVPMTQGRISLNGEPYTVRGIRQNIAQGIAYCSDDRKRDGIFADRAIFENLSAPSLQRITRLGVIDAERELALANRIAMRFEIDPERIPRPAGRLSGGNQQKVALGKWIGVEPRLLLVEEPTRGVDVGARAEIYQHLRALADGGLTIVFASSDSQEVHGLADRVATFYKGRLIRVADARLLTVEEITRDVTHPITEHAA